YGVLFTHGVSSAKESRRSPFFSSAPHTECRIKLRRRFLPTSRNSRMTDISSFSRICAGVSNRRACSNSDLLWRIEWVGGVGYNTSVPSEPRIDVCLAQLPVGETNPVSARSRSSQTKRTVKIGIGLLPHISIASVWQKRRPVVTDLAIYRHFLHIDTT